MTDAPKLLLDLMDELDHRPVTRADAQRLSMIAEAPKGIADLVACPHCALPMERFDPTFHMQRCVLRPARESRRKVSALYLFLVGAEAALSEFCKRSFDVPGPPSSLGGRRMRGLNASSFDERKGALRIALNCWLHMINGSDVCPWCASVEPIDAMLEHLSTCAKDPDVSQAAVAHDVLLEKFTERTLSISRVFLERDRASAVTTTTKYIAACRSYNQESNRSRGYTNDELRPWIAAERNATHDAAERYVATHIESAPWAAREVLGMLRWLLRPDDTAGGDVWRNLDKTEWNSAIDCVERYLRALDA